jgi:CyaY protein
MRDEFAVESTTLQRRASMSGESEFITLADRVLEAIAAALDAADADVDWTLNDGVLTIESASGGKLIVNRHVPSRELWVAAKSGGFHFRGHAGVWRDTKDGAELGAAVARLLAAQAGVSVDLSGLPAPA